MKNIAEGTLYGQRFVRVYVIDPNRSDDLTRLKDEYDYVFAYSLADMGEIDGFSREKKMTQLLTVGASADEMFETLNKNNRYKIRRSYRDPGIEVRVDDPDRSGALHFYRETKLAEGVAPDIDEDFDLVRWVNAYEGDHLVSATCWFDSGEVLRAKHIVSVRKDSGADTALIGRLTRRLFWEACLIGITEGHRHVDLGGIDVAATEKSGVAEFKQSFGGELAEVLVYRSSSQGWSDAVATAVGAGLTVV